MQTIIGRVVGHEIRPKRTSHICWRQEETRLVNTHHIPDPETTSLPSRSCIADTVTAHLAPVTRFDRGDILQDAPDRSITVELTLTRVQQVNFDVTWHAGARHLSKDITLLANGTRLKVELSTQLAIARDGCDDALGAWVSHEAQAYRRVLPAEAAFRHTPGRYGIEFTCQDCYGKCQVPCDDCCGAGRVGCPACQSAGTVHCDRCGGSTRLTCTGCTGSGHTTEQVSEQRWDAAANALITTYVPVNRPCLVCSGSGATHCTACTFGQAQCGACAGRRTVSCKGCAGAGCFNCAGCEATGVQHEWACVTASVSAQEELTFGLVDAALESLIRERIPAADLPAYGRCLKAHHVINGAALGSRYDLQIEAVYARLHAAARHFSLYGLGPQAQVLDFANIGAHLLEDDLVTLEHAVKPASAWSRQGNPALLYALKQFVASELNLLIAEQPDAHKGGPQQAASQVEAHLRNMVDAQYVQRSTVALRQGFNGLFGANLLRPALWVAGGAGLVSALVYAVGPWTYGAWHCTAWAALSGAAGWTGVEMLSVRGIMRSFPEQIGARLRSQIKAGGSVAAWRVAVAAGVMASALLGATLASKVPFFERRHQGPAQLAAKPPAPPVAASIEQDRSTATREGLYEVRQAARKFLIAHNKKNKTTFKALDPNLNEQYPKCSAPLSVSWVPKSYGLSKPAVFVRCKKSVSKHERKWESIVPVAKRAG